MSVLRLLTCAFAHYRIRKYPNFKYFYDFVVMKASKVLCDPPVLPCQRQLPRRLEDVAPQHTFTSIEDHYRIDYFETIDHVKGELQRLFQQENFIFVKSVESLLVDSANGKSLSLPTRLKELYADIWTWIITNSSKNNSRYNQGNSLGSRELPMRLFVTF